VAPKVTAITLKMRRDQRSSRSGIPSAASDEAVNEGQCSRNADQNERADMILRKKISCAGMVAAAIGKSIGRYRFFDACECHMLRLYCPPTSNSASLIWPSEQTRTASIRTAKTFAFRITA